MHRTSTGYPTQVARLRDGRETEGPAQRIVDALEVVQQHYAVSGPGPLRPEATPRERLAWQGAVLAELAEAVAGRMAVRDCHADHLGGGTAVIRSHFGPIRPRPTARNR